MVQVRTQNPLVWTPRAGKNNIGRMPGSRRPPLVGWAKVWQRYDRTALLSHFRKSRRRVFRATLSTGGARCGSAPKRRLQSSPYGRAIRHVRAAAPSRKFSPNAVPGCRRGEGGRYAEETLQGRRRNELGDRSRNAAET